MTDDLAAQFARIQQYAAGLRGLLADAQARAPRRAEGSDEKKTVHVVLDADGMPQSFTVSADWESKVKPDGLGGAVMEAFQAAVGQRLAEWTTTLNRVGWQDEVELLKRGGGGRDEGEVPPAFRKQPQQPAEPRPLGDLAEDMIAAFDRPASFAPPSPTEATATGTVGGDKVVVSLSGNGLVSCTVDGHWARRQTANQLSKALGDALATAKSRLSRRPATPNPAEGLDRIFGEAMALLNDPRRLAD
jgi:hypothetical protein